MSLHFSIALCIGYFMWFRFPCNLAAVGCCCILDGLVLGSILVGRLYYDGQRGFDACWVIVCS